MDEGNGFSNDASPGAFSNEAGSEEVMDITEPEKDFGPSREPDRFGECEACRKDDDLWVTALPGIAMSCARCKRCLTYAIYPYGICVANTAAIGGMEHAAVWWREVVFTSLAVHDVLPDLFEQDVQKAMAEISPPGSVHGAGGDMESIPWLGGE